MKAYESTPGVVPLPLEDVVNLHRHVINNVWLPQYTKGRKGAVRKFPDYGVGLRSATFEAPKGNSGIVDTSLSIVKKKKHYTHDMWIRFNDGINTEETALQSTITYYRLLWGGSLAVGFTWADVHRHDPESQNLISANVQLLPEALQRTVANDRAFSQRYHAAAMVPDDIAHLRERIDEVIVGEKKHDPATII
jgi:hypothetical protein